MTRPAFAGGVARAAVILRKGGIVAHATESVFGLACDPRNARAVERLLRVKRRPARKGLIVIAADARALRRLVDDLPVRALVSWPGPYTWLVPAAGAPRRLRGAHATLAVRVAAHAQAASLCRLAGGALVSTSANRGGERPARSARETRRRFGRALDYVLPGRTGGARTPTRIADARSGRVVRAAT